MSEGNAQAGELGEGYLTSHPFLVSALDIVGAEAIVNINTAVGQVHQASSNLVSPCYDPQRIYR